jgi:hypothetical protein
MQEGVTPTLLNLPGCVAGSPCRRAGFGDGYAWLGNEGDRRSLRACFAGLPVLEIDLVAHEGGDNNGGLTSSLTLTTSPPAGPTSGRYRTRPCEICSAHLSKSKPRSRFPLTQPVRRTRLGHQPGPSTPRRRRAARYPAREHKRKTVTTRGKPNADDLSKTKITHAPAKTDIFRGVKDSDQAGTLSRVIGEVRQLIPSTSRSTLPDLERSALGRAPRQGDVRAHAFPAVALGTGWMTARPCRWRAAEFLCRKSNRLSASAEQGSEPRDTGGPGGNERGASPSVALLSSRASVGCSIASAWARSSGASRSGPRPCTRRARRPPLPRPR